MAKTLDIWNIFIILVRLDNIQAGVAQLVEQLICNQQAGGSSPFASSIYMLDTSRPGRCPSGQREQTVNLPVYAYGGSNPPLPTLAKDEG